MVLSAVAFGRKGDMMVVAGQSGAKATVDLQYVIGKAIDAAEREGSMVLGTITWQLRKAGLADTAEILEFALHQQIPQASVNQILDHWIVDNELAIHNEMEAGKAISS